MSQRIGMTVIGTCSICGGAVTVPEIWHCVIPAVPTCENCGAVSAEHGPIIPMRKVEPIKTEWKTVS